jgi:hypothetical protein
LWVVSAAHEELGERTAAEAAATDVEINVRLFMGGIVPLQKRNEREEAKK